jgi:hypothetical protein
MDKATRTRLEKSGFWVGDAEDFLGLNDEERQMVELRLKLSRLVRRLREERGRVRSLGVNRSKWVPSCANGG